MLQSRNDDTEVVINVMLQRWHGRFFRFLCYSLLNWL